MSRLDELVSMTHTTALRPTLWQRFVFRVTGQWPQSYVDARLAAADRDAAELRAAVTSRFSERISVAPPRQVFKDWA